MTNMIDWNGFCVGSLTFQRTQLEVLELATNANERLLCWEDSPSQAATTTAPRAHTGRSAAADLMLPVLFLSTALVAPYHGTRLPVAVAQPPLSRRAAAPISVASIDVPAAVPPTGQDAWAADLDYVAFRKEVHELGQRLGDNQGEADVRHLKRMIAWSNACGGIGLVTMWLSHPLGRLVSVLGLSTWTCTRWTMIGHHICHGGYNRQDDPKNGGTGRFTTNGFAVGSVWRRARDWFDWMLPEAWNVEHNNLHHYRLGESGDPDLVQRNLELMRDIRL